MPNMVSIKTLVKESIIAMTHLRRISITLTSKDFPPTELSRKSFAFLDPGMSSKNTRKMS